MQNLFARVIVMIKKPLPDTYIIEFVSSKSIQFKTNVIADE